MSKPTNFDIPESLEVVWTALHGFREDCIPESDSMYDEQWDDICTAMAWITESTQVNHADIADAAMCIWEFALSHQESCHWLELISPSWGEGAATARDNALAIASQCDKSYLADKERGECDSFDWDYVPRFMRIVIEKYDCPKSFVDSGDLIQVIQE